MQDDDILSKEMIDNAVWSYFQALRALSITVVTHEKVAAALGLEENLVIASVKRLKPMLTAAPYHVPRRLQAARIADLACCARAIRKGAPARSHHLNPGGWHPRKIEAVLDFMLEEWDALRRNDPSQNTKDET